MHCKQEISEISHLYRIIKGPTSIPQLSWRSLMFIHPFPPYTGGTFPHLACARSNLNRFRDVRSRPRIVQYRGGHEPSRSLELLGLHAATRQIWGGNVWMGFVYGIPSR